MRSSLFYCALLIFTLLACNNASKEKKINDTGATLKKEVLKDSVALAEIKKPPIINITDSVAVKRIVICIKDSATNYERIAGKLAQIYGVKLAEVFKKNRLKVTGSPMAWYKTHKAPYFFEAGIPVNKKPAKLPKGVFIRETMADSVILAHFYGPYDLIPQGYDAVKEWMKDNKRMAHGQGYEIYITNPLDKKGKPVDPYKIQTDIIFPIR